MMFFTPQKYGQKKQVIHTRLWEAYEKLEYTERKMLSQRCGFCFECRSVFYMDHNDLDEYGEPKISQSSR